MSFLANLNWRFATKKFDKDKKVSEQDLGKILEAIRLAPSSFGLQPWHVFIITDERLKQKIQKYSFDQPQVSSCSHLFIFCARIDVKKRIDDYIELLRSIQEFDESKLSMRKEMMLASTQKKLPEQLWEWARLQVYIALGFALAACAELKIDACPMGGFESGKVDKLLGLSDFMQSVVFLAVGYRTEEPRRLKIRFSGDDLFTYR